MPQEPHEILTRQNNNTAKKTSNTELRKGISSIRTKERKYNDSRQVYSAVGQVLQLDP